MNSHYPEAEQLDVDEISHKGLENRTSEIHRKNLLWLEEEFASFICKKEWGSSADSIRFSRSLAEQVTSIFRALGLEITPLSHRVEKKRPFPHFVAKSEEGRRRERLCLPEGLFSGKEWILLPWFHVAWKCSIVSEISWHNRNQGREEHGGNVERRLLGNSSLAIADGYPEGIWTLTYAIFKGSGGARVIWLY